MKMIKREKPIGKVTHYFPHIKVGIIKFTKPVKNGTEIRFEGATTQFSQMIESMQYNHKSITLAPKGKQIGIKVKKRVREGDCVYGAVKNVSVPKKKSVKPKKQLTKRNIKKRKR